MEPKMRRSGIRSLGKMISGLLKRALDVVAALFGLILLSPALVLIALLIKRDTPGPVFYWGRRMGRRGGPSRCSSFGQCTRSRGAITVRVLHARTTTASRPWGGGCATPS